MVSSAFDCGCEHHTDDVWIPCIFPANKYELCNFLGGVCKQTNIDRKEFILVQKKTGTKAIHPHGIISYSFWWFTEVHFRIYGLGVTVLNWYSFATSNLMFSAMCFFCKNIFISTTFLQAITILIAFMSILFFWIVFLGTWIHIITPITPFCTCALLPLRFKPLDTYDLI